MKGTHSPRRRWLIQLSGLMLGLLSRQVLAVGRKTPELTTEGTLSNSDFRHVLAKALNGQTWQPSNAIQLDVPQVAENGAIVPITLESHLPNTRRLLIFAEKNPGPLLAEFHFESGVSPWASLRVKLNESGPVLVIAESEGRFYGTQTSIKVMMGGCG